MKIKLPIVLLLGTLAVVVLHWPDFHKAGFVAMGFTFAAGSVVFPVGVALADGLRTFLLFFGITSVAISLLQPLVALCPTRRLGIVSEVSLIFCFLGFILWSTSVGPWSGLGYLAPLVLTSPVAKFGWALTLVSGSISARAKALTPEEKRARREYDFSKDLPDDSKEFSMRAYQGGPRLRL